LLFTPDGKQITQVPHTADLKEVVRLLGDRRADGVRSAVNRIIDEISPDTETGRRTFSSSKLGEQLKPWPYPLAGIYDVALKIAGKKPKGRQVYDRSLRIFELFVWECIMARREKWVVYDQDDKRVDSHPASTDAVYVEQGPDETNRKNR
jgi:hypothetical protein